MGMQLESLKVFCDVVRFRSFSQAAAANEVTQSAASQIVLQLEKRLGVQLVDRSTRPLQLTHQGQVYYEGCKGMVDQYLEVEAAVRSLERELAANIQVAAIYSVGLGDMSLYVERFAKEQPNVEVHIEYLHPNRVYEKVLDGTADFGLVSFPRKSRELEEIAWREEEMVLVCAPHHRLATHRSVRLAQLEGEKYIGFDKDLKIRREIDRFLRDHGVAVDVVLEFDNIENIKKAIEISAGVALLPLPTLQREIHAGTLAAVSLANGSLVRPLRIIQRRNHKLSSSAARFIELLQQPDVSSPSRRKVSGVFASGTKPQPSGNGAHRGSNGKARSSKRTV
jgi:DNA-binding transcriptional LysR family regulator